MQQQVGALRLARTGLAGDDDALVLPGLQHGVVGGVGDGEDVWRELAQPLVLVHLDVLGVVDGEELEGVERDQDRAHVGVDIGVVEPAESTGQMVQVLLLLFFLFF